MFGPLLYLTLCSWRNGFLGWARRLREPRYSAGFAAGVLYFYWFFVRSQPRAVGPASRGIIGVLSGPYHGVAEVAIGGLLLLLFAMAWFGPAAKRDPLGFTPSDAQFLFPAPITRRHLVHYKLLRSVVRPLLTAVFFTFVLRPRSWPLGLVTFVGVAVVIETLNLYLIGVSLVKLHARRPIDLLAPRVLAGAAIATVVTAIARDWTALTQAATGGALTTELARLGGEGAAHVVLTPFIALARVPLAGTAAGLVQALPAGLLLAGVAYLWALRSDRATDAVAVEPTVSAPRGSAVLLPDTVPPSSFRLALTGPAELALLWKNMISVSRYLSPRLLLRLLPMFVAMLFAMMAISRAEHSRGVAALGAMVALGVAGFTVLMGPQLARNDLRQDLSYLAMLKAWPIRGAIIVRGEVLAPALVLSVIAWAAVATAWALSSSLPFATRVPLLERASFALAIMLIVPGLILTQLVVHNAMALLFPAWVSAVRTRGVDVAGQRLLMMAGLLLTLAVGCLPAALAAVVVGFAIRGVLGVVPVLVPAAVALVILILECGIATEALGNLFERTDISATQP